MDTFVDKLGLPITIILMLIIAGIGAYILFAIIKAGVRAGTQDLIDEVRRQREVK